MFRAYSTRSAQVRWWIVVGWVVSIYLAIPVARVFQRYIEATIGREFFLWFVASFGVALTALCLTAFRRNAAKLFPWRFPGLFVVCCIFAYSTWVLRENPERTLHFVQYGVLCALLFFALIGRQKDWSILMQCVLGCAVVGTFDEIIQWITPGRYFDFQDIGINAGAALIVAVCISIGLAPKSLSGMSYSGVRGVSTLLLVQLLLLLFCISNTPQFVRWYSSRIPALNFLSSNESIMAEYGYRHDLPGITFYSRLTLDALQEEDRRRGVEAANIINEWADGKRYSDFLKSVSPAIDPFVYELRVRLFRRDAYWGRANMLGLGHPDFSRKLTVALKEHLILDTFFQVAYRNSKLMIQPKDADYFARHALKDSHYISPVGSGLIAWATQKQLSFGLLFLIVLCAVWRFFLLMKSNE